MGWCLWGCEEGGYGNVTSGWELEPTGPDRMRGHCRGDTGEAAGESCMLPLLHLIPPLAEPHSEELAKQRCTSQSLGQQHGVYVVW